jgi:hypothetical protein
MEREIGRKRKLDDKRTGEVGRLREEENTGRRKKIQQKLVFCPFFPTKGGP